MLHTEKVKVAHYPLLKVDYEVSKDIAINRCAIRLSQELVLIAIRQKYEQ